MGTLIYQMYPSTWGNFRKMAEHLPRLEKLRIDYVWISPCFRSPWDDGGYDVEDYMEIDPKFGTMEDFDFFVAEAKKRRIRVLLDLVMNHTSTHHEWFQKSLMGNPKYKDYYIWSDKDLGWRNNFDGGPAFRWNKRRNQYYLHLFCESQVDLNWRNPDVLEEFQKIIDFWTEEHGVAGFRLDVAQYLYKDLTPSLIPKCFGTAKGFLKYWQKPETVEILHKLFDGRGLFVFSEAGYATKRQFRKMAGKDGPLNGSLDVMTYSLGPATNNFKLFQKLVKSWQKELGFISCAESHDAPRAPSRYQKRGEEIMNNLFVGGDEKIVCLYQGQELGLRNPKLSLDIRDYADVQTIMKYKSMIEKGIEPREAMKKLRLTSRDNARQPIDLEEYARQEADESACLNWTRRRVETWKYFH